MDEVGWESGVSISILGPNVVLAHVYLIADKRNPHILCRTTIRADAITFAGSRLEH